PALSGVSLEIRKHSSVALVGRTGAGKSTLADVAAGLLAPGQGRVEVDGAPLSPERALAWQRAVGYVPQEIFLLDDTLQRNIALGSSHDPIDPQAVREAARVARVDEFLDRGLDTVLGERGVTLSGGQRQRVGIARALYHDPDLLILDEATSSLDNLTERAVIQAIEDLAASKTLLVIAHRLSTVKACQTIHLMEEGRIVASGSYQELMESCPSFRELALV
ncbi:MAG: ATP-binding cassette domain-containing protein, partial [Candidatus Eremiobacterota bacterium]